MVINYNFRVTTICPINKLPINLDVSVSSFHTIYVEDIQSAVDSTHKVVTQEDFHKSLRHKLPTAYDIKITGLHHGFEIITQG